MKSRVWFVLLSLALTLACSSSPGLEIKVLNAQLDHPWSLVFLPDGDMLISERGGTIKRLSASGKLLSELQGLPDIAVAGQGGLFDLVLAPDFNTNQRLYLSWAGPAPAPHQNHNATHLGQAALIGNQLEDFKTLLIAEPYVRSNKHFGGRIAVDPSGHIFLTLGERGQRQRAQSLGDHNGSVLRLNLDGSIPGDNPFVHRGSARPAIFSYGHRNPQGAAINPRSHQLWIHEHGPRGGDELNIVKPGANYGWPVATLGREYRGPVIGQPHIAGMEDSIYHWIPSIGPSGMSFYTHSRFPRWRNSLFIGALAQRHLVRLELNGDTVVGEEKLLQDRGWRIRDVREGPDGYLYVLTDESPGKLIRLAP